MGKPFRRAPAYFRLSPRRAYAVGWDRFARKCTDATEREAVARSPENLGEEVAGGLINAFNEMETAHRTGFQELRQDIAALRSEFKQGKWTFVLWLGTIGIVMLLLRTA